MGANGGLPLQLSDSPRSTGVRAGLRHLVERALELGKRVLDVTQTAAELFLDGRDEGPERREARLHPAVAESGQLNEARTPVELVSAAADQAPALERGQSGRQRRRSHAEDLCQRRRPHGLDQAEGLRTAKSPESSPDAASASSSDFPTS